LHEALGQASDVEMLFKHPGLLKERMEDSGSVEFKWKGE
jgi:hypothetical protein